MQTFSLDISYSPTSVRKMMYEADFIEAHQRSSDFGLSTPVLALADHRLLNDSVIEEMQDVIRDAFGVIPLYQIALHCLVLNLKLEPVVAEYLACPVYYTIGYIELGDEVMFEQSDDSLKGMLENGIDGPTTNLHSWLRCPPWRS